MRELRERVRQAVRLAGGGAISAEALLLAARRRRVPSFKDAKRAFETRYVESLLRRCDGNISRAARLAKKDRKDFYDVIRRTGVDPSLVPPLARRRSRRYPARHARRRRADDLDRRRRRPICAAAEKLVARGGRRSGAELVALPENFAFLRREGAAIPCAQALDGEIVGALRALGARDTAIWLVGGTLPEAIAGRRRASTTPASLISPRRRDRGRLPQDPPLRRRSRGAGRPASTASRHASRRAASWSSLETPVGVVGLSVCYDLRFPELYRALAARGARFLCVPSAFTRETGSDHWEVLLRARAIENQCFVLAPAQCGAAPGGSRSATAAR